MPIGPGKRRVQAIIDENLAAKIQDIAQRMEVSESTCIYMLLDCVVANEGWLIRAVTSQFGKKLGRLLGIAGKDRDRFVDANSELDADHEQPEA